jgi:A/G-specific adenine glycosylase
MSIPAFIKHVTNYYREHGRSMPWRSDTRSYHIVVSEIMLQQTQVSRVLNKFDSWTKRFPDWQSLASASTREVIQEWSGLGYNRRALNLHKLAQTLVNTYKGKLPQMYDELVELPGIGPNTAGSILAFAFNIPRPFIETNIRSVFIHHFFSEIEKVEGKKACKKIDDDEIFPFIEKALAQALKSGHFKDNPREWYWALMDYGSFLKRQLPNPSRQSAHHVKQSRFEGSNRELRSLILKQIMKRPSTGETLVKQFKEWPREQVERNVEAMVKEGFIKRTKMAYKIV